MNKKGSHFSFDDRQIIEKGISNSSSKVAIAKTLGKDKSSVGKEIKLHRVLKHKSSMPLECNNFPKCSHGRNCIATCEHYSPFHCSRRDRTPGACNGCNNYRYCRFDKYYYDAITAQHEYKDSLVDSREGVNLTTQEAISLGEIIKPLIQKGHSPYDIITNHPELGICEKTLYNYIESGVFKCVGILDVDLRIKPGRKMTKKKKNTFKKREDRKFLIGRTYKEFQLYIEEHPTCSIVQMDTVYNDGSNGPFIQTFKFLDYGLLFALYHDSKTAADMKQGVDQLEDILGSELFHQIVEVLLTDRGSEFSDAYGMETGKDGTRRTRVYYCDPMQSGQKGSLENIHKELRYICPKGYDLRKLGLRNQGVLNLVVSHIDSSPKEFLKNKTPIEMTRFLREELLSRLFEFGLQEIEKDKVVLKPYLLQNK